MATQAGWDAPELLSQVWQAFAGVPLPQGRVAPCLCPECEDIVRLLQGHKREGLSREEAEAFSTLHLLAPEAVHYYFPAILAKALEPPETDFLIDVLYFLSLTGQHTQSQVRLLDERQQRAVYQFLIFVRDNRQADVENYGYEEELAQALKNWASAGPSAA